MGKTKFYAVRKGKRPGIYESWAQCEEQTRGFKGCEFKSFASLPEAQAYMTGSPSKTDSRLQPRACGVEKKRASPHRRTLSIGILQLRPVTADSETQGIYQLEFDGASKGNPGKAGAGALLLNPDSTVESELSEGLGNATNNVAEYRGLILGLKTALAKGVTRISIRGDSKLVCQQVKGLWQVKNEGLKPLWEEVKQLQTRFEHFSIEHVDREFNPRADALANLAVSMPETKFVSSSQN